MDILLSIIGFSGDAHFAATASTGFPLDPIDQEETPSLSGFESLMGPNIKALLKDKMDADEKIVRKALVKAWTKILEKYARKGIPIPSPEAIYIELLNKGVDAAVDAVVDAHWFIFTFMIRESIQEKIEKGLERFDLPTFIGKVQFAQTHPEFLQELREEIKRCVLFDLVI